MRGPAPTAVSTFRPSLNVMTAPFEDTFDRPDAGESTPWPAFEAGTAARAHDGGKRDAGRARAKAASPLLPLRDGGEGGSPAASATEGGSDGGAAVITPSIAATSAPTGSR